jgi:hypothetical protein
LKYIFVIFSLFTITVARSQKMYFGLGGGYCFPIASQNLATNINIGVNQIEKSVVKGSYGEGVNFNCFVGYRLKSQFSVELDFVALKSKLYNANYTKDTSFQVKTSLSAYMVKSNVLLRFDIPESSIYFKVGPSFRLASSIITETTVYDYQSNTETFSKWKLTHGFSVGGFAAVGTTRTINKRIKCYGEVSLAVQSWAPKYGNIMEYKINGVDGKEALNISQTTINYSNSFVADNKNYSGWKPSQEPKSLQPFSGVALKIGIQLKLGKIHNE